MYPWISLTPEQCQVMYPWISLTPEQRQGICRVPINRVVDGIAYSRKVLDANTWWVECDNKLRVYSTIDWRRGYVAFDVETMAIGVSIANPVDVYKPAMGAQLAVDRMIGKKPLLRILRLPVEGVVSRSVAKYPINVTIDLINQARIMLTEFYKNKPLDRD
jgi:hypothetical protein